MKVIMTNYSLFLDDIRNPTNVTWVKLPDVFWVVVRNYDEFVNYIQKYGLPEFITFDHDLSFEHYPISEQNPGNHIPYDQYTEKTGYDCAKWLISYCLDRGLDFPNYTVHSMNPVGKSNIISLIESYKKMKLY